MTERSRLGFELNSTLEKDLSESSPKNYIFDAVNKLSEQIYTDSLTGCYNRHFFENFKKNNFDPNRDNNNLALVFTDVNGLKEINDTVGHTAGDELIKNTANFFKLSFRKEDLIVRLGGDEFVIICHNYENNSNFKEKFISKITNRLNDKPPTNFAFGIDIYNKKKDFSNLDNTQKCAEDLMYQDKIQKKASNS